MVDRFHIIRPVVLAACMAALGVPLAHAQSESDTIGALRERIGRLELEQARLQQENQTMLTQLQVVETRKKLKLAQQDEGVGVLPLIVSLSRLDDAWSVRLMGADGVITTFFVGDIVQRGVRIVSINASGVKVELGAAKQAQRVALAYAGATAATPGAAPTPGMPMPMPMPRMPGMAAIEGASTAAPR